MATGLASMHILLVEDNALVASGLQAGLGLQGFACTLAHTLAQARALQAQNRFDACVLDLGLPDGDGLQLLRQWRAAGVQLPVLILSARSALEDRIDGFRSGSDDHLAKPFDLTELALRLQALLRRAPAAQAQDGAQEPLALGALTLEPASGLLWRGDERIDLPRREALLLAALARAHGRVLSTAQLHDSLYDSAESVESNTVNVHVHHLRKKLGADIIETVRGLGFRLGAAYCSSGGAPAHAPQP
ncbi:response regulator [Comamonas faecalis]|uniref:Response regulator n=2 Tax=Comamonas faecalis TaxID=1387849 RepID=A0ABP7RV85_9BURK